MSNITRSTVKSFLLEKKGYLKKSPQNIAKAIWSNSAVVNLPKSYQEVQQDLKIIRIVQSDLRAAENYIASKEQQDVLDFYNKILDKRKNKKRLFFDIEVSPNIVLSWSVGRKIDISYDAILQERAIICICYKWEGDTNVYSIKWDNGDDKEMLTKFAKVIDTADEVVTQNGDNFDIKWLRTRCLYHRIPVSSKFNSIDTLKLARASFRFNSNRLDYMGAFIGKGRKIKTEFDLWKSIVIKNDQNSLKTMIDYCKQDVILLEDVYQQLQTYCPQKKFKYKL